MKTQQYLRFLTVSTAILLLISVLLFRGSVNNPSNSTTAINTVLGDESFIELFGNDPDYTLPDEIRIRTHLEYVESILRKDTPDGLTEIQLERRQAYLHYLREYYVAGDFPVNDDHPDTRRPTFISQNGNICAVGHLVEQAVGREFAEEISASYKYSFISEIDDHRFLNWAEESGFSIEELAMIQPTYQYQMNDINTNNNVLGVPYSVASGTLLSANALYWLHDLNNMGMFNYEANNHWVGMGIGTGTLLFGVFNLDNTHTWRETSGFNTVNYYTEANHLKTSVSVGHMVVGAVTIARSAYRLFIAADYSPSGSGLILTHIPAVSEAGTEMVGAVGYNFSF